MSWANPRPCIAALRCVIAALLLAAGGSAGAAARPIYKCTLADGKTTFSDEPCSTPKPVDAPSPAAAPASKAPTAGDPADCTTWMPPEESVTVEQPQKIADEDLPHDASGRPVEILISKRGPATVAAACSAMVSSCSHRSADPRGSIDVCFKSAPRCATDQPWQEGGACCPQACWQKFVDLRRQCIDPSSASYRALFQEHCVAGAAGAAQAAQSP